jgi:GntR family transcriptional regulator
MMLDKRSPIPVYYQLRNIIQKKIQNGEYKEGELIPSEREFSESFGISRMTVRQALNHMVAEGLLIREKGRGTFVAKKKIEQRNIDSFSESARKKGLTPSTQVLNFAQQRVSEDIAEILGLSSEDSVYVIKRLRSADDVPVALEEVFIPVRLCPNLEQYDLSGSLYRIINESYGISIAYMDNVIEASVPTAEEKKLLKASSNVPLLRISGVSFTTNDQKFSYERDVYRADQYAYNARIYLDRK